MKTTCAQRSADFRMNTQKHLYTRIASYKKNAVCYYENFWTSSKVWRSYFLLSSNISFYVPGLIVYLFNRCFLTICGQSEHLARSNLRAVVLVWLTVLCTLCLSYEQRSSIYLFPEYLSASRDVALKFFMKSAYAGRWQVMSLAVFVSHYLYCMSNNRMHSTCILRTN